MKPPQPDRLDEVLDRGLEARLRDGDKAFLCRSGETMYRIPKKSILYFASDRRQVSCVAATRRSTCLLYTSDAAAHLIGVRLGGRRIIH